jgi:hypothetical protein
MGERRLFHGKSFARDGHQNVRQPISVAVERHDFRLPVLLNAADRRVIDTGEPVHRAPASQQEDAHVS